MNHLTVQQLSSALDGALAGPSLELVVRHLASCHECRDRQARLARYDDALRRLLAPDPHEFFLEDLTRRAESIVAAIARGMPVPPMVTSYPLADDEDPAAPTEPPPPPRPELGRAAEIAREAGYGRIGAKPRAPVRPQEDPEHAQRLLEALERGISDEFSQLTVQGLAAHSEPDGPLFDLPSWVKEGSARGRVPRRPAPEVRTVRLKLDRLDEHFPRPRGEAIEEASRREDRAPAAGGAPTPGAPMRSMGPDPPAQGEDPPAPGVPMRSMGPDPPARAESPAPVESREQDPTPVDPKPAESAAPAPLQAASAVPTRSVDPPASTTPGAEPMPSMGRPALPERREPSASRRPAPLPPIREAVTRSTRARSGRPNARGDARGQPSRTLLLFALSCLGTLLGVMLAYRLLVPAFRGSGLAPKRGAHTRVQLAGQDSSDAVQFPAGGGPMRSMGRPAPAPLDSLLPSPAPTPADSGAVAPPADSLANKQGR